jgi:vancomycin permeability regulator SanA
MPIPHQLVLFVLSTSSVALMLLSYLASKLNFQFPADYIFNYPYERVIPGIALMGSFFIRIYVITLLINLFFNSGFVVYVKSLLTTLFVFIISIGLVYLLTTKNGYDKLEIMQSNNAIAVVLGAAVWDDVPSTLFKGRIKKANELLQEHKVSKIQLTGSNAPGEISEAKAAFNYGLKLGIRHHLMAIEENTTTTSEQIKFVKKNLVSNTKLSYILIVSDQFHLTRVLEICKFFEVKAIGVASDYNLTSEKLLYYRLRESIALLLFWLFAI